MSRKNNLEIKRIESIIEQRVNKGFRPKRTGKHRKGKKNDKNNDR